MGLGREGGVALPSRPSDEDADVAADEDAWRLSREQASRELDDPRGVSQSLGETRPHQSSIRCFSLRS